MKYPEINRFGLTECHKERLCYPYTDAPAFTFWESPQEGESMRAWQDGRCALCGFRDSLVKDRWALSFRLSAVLEMPARSASHEAGWLARARLARTSAAIASRAGSLCSM